ncbi:hypothetical protein IG631_07761 [Alternaria alternata]|nr:hypothetical protein IG631_07761 [Alternaria alternata]
MSAYDGSSYLKTFERTALCGASEKRSSKPTINHRPRTSLEMISLGEPCDIMRWQFVQYGNFVGTVRYSQEMNSRALNHVSGLLSVYSNRSDKDACFRAEPIILYARHHHQRRYRHQFHHHKAEMTSSSHEMAASCRSSLWNDKPVTIISVGNTQCSHWRPEVIGSLLMQSGRHRFASRVLTS